MNRVMLCHIQPDGQVLSPAVGRYFRFSPNTPSHGLGVLERLGKRYLLTLPEGTPTAISCVPSGTYVDVGQTLAHITAASESPKKQTHTADHWLAYAPTAGFLVLTHDTGVPFQTHGNPIHKGDIIAILEFMKIRMEITYAGPEPAVFDQYIVQHHSSVQKDQPIARCCVDVRGNQLKE